MGLLELTSWLYSVLPTSKFFFNIRPLKESFQTLHTWALDKTLSIKATLGRYPVAKFRKSKKCPAVNILKYQSVFNSRKHTIFPKHFGVSALRRYITGTYQNILFVKRFMVSRTPTFLNKSRNGESIHIRTVTHFSAQIGPAIWWSKVLGKNFYSLVTRWFMLSFSLYDELLWKSGGRLYFRQKISL